MLIIHRARLAGVVLTGWMYNKDDEVYIKTLERERVEVLEDGDMRRIGEMSLQVLDGASTGHVMLNEATHGSHHGEPAISDLFCAQSFLFFSTLGHAHGIKQPSPWVSDISSGASAAFIIWIGVDGSGIFYVLPAADFSPIHHEHLHNEEGVGVGYIAIKEGSFSPVWQRAVDERIAKNLRSCHAGNAKHCPPGMHQLSLLIPLQSCLVLTCSGDKKINDEKKPHVNVRGEQGRCMSCKRKFRFRL